MLTALQLLITCISGDLFGGSVQKLVSKLIFFFFYFDCLKSKLTSSFLEVVIHSLFAYMPTNGYFRRKCFHNPSLVSFFFVMDINISYCLFVYRYFLYYFFDCFLGSILKLLTGKFELKMHRCFVTLCLYCTK